MLQKERAATSRARRWHGAEGERHREAVADDENDGEQVACREEKMSEKHQGGFRKIYGATPKS